jgi:hypothetical protein
MIKHEVALSKRYSAQAASKAAQCYNEALQRRRALADGLGSIEQLGNVPMPSNEVSFIYHLKALRYMKLLKGAFISRHQSQQPALQ